MQRVKTILNSKTRTPSGGSHSILRLLCSTAAICCVLAAIKLPSKTPKVLPSKTVKPELIAYIDLSNSISPELGATFLKSLKPYAKNISLKLLPFSQQISKHELTWKDQLSFIQLRKTAQDLDLKQTRLDQVLNNQRDSKALLLSDGRSTSLINQLNLQAAPSNRAAIYPILPENNLKFKKDVEILNFSSPTQSHKNEILKLNLSLENHADYEQTVLISFYSDLKKLETITAKLKARAVESFEVSSEFKANEFVEYRALVEIQDPKEQQAAQEIRTYTQSALENEVLLINSDLKEATNISALLKEEGLHVTSLLPAELSVAKLSLKDYSLVVFNNVPKSALSNNFIQEVVSYVENSGKFLMLGGNKSFGLGGYKFSPIEEILPVKLVKPQAEEQRLNLAVQLLIDKSFSMEDGEKIEFAKLAAREVYKTLKDDDYFGVIGFEDQMFEAIRLTPVRNLRGLAENRISLLFPAGGTRLLPALGTATNRLDLIKAGRKHLIILTDGKLPDGYQNQRYYLELVDNLRLSGVTVSCFLIGGEMDTLLEEMAKRGGGAYHRTNDASSLPRLFIQDVNRSGKELTKHENQNFRVLAKHFKDPEFQSFPDVQGYVDTELKPDVELGLFIRGKQRDYPLLVFKNVGQGKTAAFTSDLNTRWSRDWYSWTKLKKFMRLFLNKLELNADRSDIQLDYQLQYQQTANQFQFFLNVFNQHQDADLKVSLKSETGQSKPIQLTQDAIGAYSFHAQVEETGKQELQITYKNQKLKPLIFYANPAQLMEQNNLGLDNSELARIAKITGGKLNPTVQDLINTKTEPQATQPLADDFKLNKVFLYLAFGFLMLEILIRRRVLLA